MIGFLIIFIGSLYAHASFQFPLQATLGPIYLNADKIQDSPPEYLLKSPTSIVADYGHSKVWALYRFKSSYSQYPIYVRSCHQCHQTRSFLFLGDSLIYSWNINKTILASSPSKLILASRQLFLEEGREYKLWVNMESNYSIDTKLQVQDLESNVKYSYHFLIWSKIYIGAILALISSHFLFLFAFRNKIFLFYLLFECSTTLITLYYNSIENYLLPFSFSQTSLLFLFAFAYLGLTQFTFHFLKIPTHKFLFFKVLKQTPYAYFLFPILQIMFTNFYFPFFEIFILQMIVVSVLCLIKVFKGHRESLSLLLALSAFSFSLCIVYLNNKYLLFESLNGKAHIVHFIGHITMILIITAPIVSKILKQIRQSKYHIQRSSLHQLQLISNLNSELKILNHSRTIHLDYPIPNEKLKQLDCHINLYSVELEEAIAKASEERK
jgi:hypothetical protein